MIELPFGSVSSVWPGGVAGWLPTATPLVNRTAGSGFTSQPLGVPNVGSTPLFRPPQPLNPPVPETYGPIGAPLSLAPAGPFPGVGFGNPFLPNPYVIPTPPPAIFGPGGFATTIPALLMAVAARRGQPAGPASDQEIEDFTYDVLELFPGTGEIEVRCESSRVTLTGTVHQKRLKHDVGEIVWTIPGINDVQNNLTIATKRRLRPGGREGEGQTAATTRKQA